MSRYQDDPTRGKSATVRPFAKPKLKRPEDDPVIAMARDRHKKGLQIEKQRQAMSGASGAVLHKILELKALEADLRAINEGVQEYQDQVDLMNDRKRDLAKIVKVEQAWCDNFNKLIGPFEAKYEESKAHKDGQSGPLAVPQLAAQGEKNGRHWAISRSGSARRPSLWDIKQGHSARPLAPPQRTRGTPRAEVKVSFDFAKGKYKESLQQLIDDFGFHPAFKRWFDEF